MKMLLDKMKTNQIFAEQIQTGAVLIEFWLVAPVLLLVGLGTVQIGLIYHAKNTLNYATFEAARVGAVNHAGVDKMREELGLRLAPIVGGDGSTQGVSAAILHPVLMYKTRIEHGYEY